ncbi:MAG: phytoene desaturase family protein, partial [Cyclobacteriaceae bacterium]
MNYADMGLGTWYPKGGMHKIVEGMVKLAEEKGVKILLNKEVVNIPTFNGSIKSVMTTSGDTYSADIIVGGADYNHLESLLPKEKRNYSESYWENRTMAPSSLLFYLGVNKKLKNLIHHNLFFDEDFKQHAEEIYETKKWPSKPLFYVSLTSKTDETAAPEGCENVFILIPTAPGLTDDDESVREKYYNIVMDRLEKLTNQEIRGHVIYKKSYAHSDFIKDYHAFKGNAYGLANTLTQTAILKPSLKSKKIKNLFYTGQLTVPGPGVPPSLISGIVVADQVEKEFKIR